MYNLVLQEQAQGLITELRDELSAAGKLSPELAIAVNKWLETARGDRYWNYLTQMIEDCLKQTQHLSLTTQQAILTGLQMLYRETRVEWRARPNITKELYTVADAPETTEGVRRGVTRDGEDIYLRPANAGDVGVRSIYVQRIDLAEEPPLRMYDIKIPPQRENLPSWMDKITLPSLYLIRATQFFTAQDGTLFAC